MTSGDSVIFKDSKKRVAAPSASRVLHQKLGHFAKLEAAELSVLDDIVQQPRIIPANTELVREGDAQNNCYVMLEGWGFCYKYLKDGTRQIIHFPISGDFMGVRNRLFRVSDHSFATITRSQMAVLSLDRFQAIIESMPRLGQAFMWSAARDEAIIVEHLVDLGRRSAAERIAHFLLELADRIQFAGLREDGDLRCPLTQDHLGDALGLTSIHVNRILRQFRERHLVSLSRGLLHIDDLQGLREIAAYDDEYLNQHG